MGTLYFLPPTSPAPAVRCAAFGASAPRRSEQLRFSQPTCQGHQEPGVSKSCPGFTRAIPTDVLFSIEMVRLSIA